MSFKVKGIYGGLLAKKGGFRIKPNNTVLHELGKLAVKYVEQEATKVAGRSKGIPKSRKFLKSFSYKIVGKSTIQIDSSWPYVKPETYVSGRRGWRVGKPGKRIPIKTKSGELIFRTMPRELKMGNCVSMWCHPGLTKHTFVRRGLQRAKDEILKKHGKTIVGNHIGKKDG